MEIVEELSRKPQDYMSRMSKEIREHIFNYLPQSSAIIARKVNQQWNDEIDTLYKFEIHLDDTLSSETVQKLLKLRIKWLVLSPGNKSLLTPISNLNPIRKTFLTFPKMMRRLELWSTKNITQENYWSLLEECGETLSSLQVNVDKCWARNPSLNKCLPIQFKNLKRLHLTDSRLECYIDHAANTANFLNDIFFNTIELVLSSPCKLKTLILEAKINEDKILCENNTLKIISKICGKLVEKQSSLEYLKVEKILPFESSQMYRILSQNSKSLLRLEIYFPRLDNNIEAGIFDGSFLGDCVNLKELYLVLPWSGPQGGLVKNVKNFRLPSSIEKICTAGFRIEGEELKSSLNEPSLDLASVPYTVCVYGGLKEGEEGIRGDTNSSLKLKAPLVINNKWAVVKEIISGFDSTGILEEVCFRSALHIIYDNGSTPLLILKKRFKREEQGGPLEMPLAKGEGPSTNRNEFPYNL